MKTSKLLFLSLLLLSNISFAQEFIIEYEGDINYAVEYKDPDHKPNVDVVEIGTNDEKDSEEVYDKKTGQRLSPYKSGLTLIGGSFEMGTSKFDGSFADNQESKLTYKGGRLHLSLPVIGTSGKLGGGGDSVTGANLGRLRLELGAGQLHSQSLFQDGKLLNKVSPYVHGSISPTLGLYVGDQPKFYEKDKISPSIFGLEMGPSVGFMCNNMDDQTKLILQIKEKNCHATVGAIFQATISYLSGGLQIKKNLGGTEKTDYIFNIGLQIPLSSNTVDTDSINDEQRGIQGKEQNLPGAVDHKDNTRAVSV